MGCVPILFKVNWCVVAVIVGGIAGALIENAQTEQFLRQKMLPDRKLFLSLTCKALGFADSAPTYGAHATALQKDREHANSLSLPPLSIH